MALFDSASLGAGREDVPVAELGPGALNRRAARGGRAGRRTGDGAERGRSAGRGRRAGGREKPRVGTSGRSRGEGGPGDGWSERRATGPARRAPRLRRGPFGRGVGSVPFPIPPGAPAGRPVPVGPTGGPTSRAAVYAGGGGEARPSSIPTPIRSPSPGRSACGCSPTAPAPARSWPRRCGARACPTRRRESVLERFDEVGLIDDAAFAGQWVRSRHTQRGLARRAIAMELRRKGVSDEDAGEALAEVDAGVGGTPGPRAGRPQDALARPRHRRAAGCGGRRLVGMLARKGYGAGIAYRVVRRRSPNAEPRPTSSGTPRSLTTEYADPGAACPRPDSWHTPASPRAHGRTCVSGPGGVCGAGRRAIHCSKGPTASTGGCPRASPPARRPRPRSTPKAAQLQPLPQAALQLGENPGKRASAITWSHSSAACSSLGNRLITGPKNATPARRLEVQDRRADVLPGQRECLVGLGLQLGVPRRRRRARPPGALGSPTPASTGSHELRGCREPPGRRRRQRLRGGRSKMRAPRAAYSGPTASLPCSARVRAAIRSRRSPAVWPAS